MSVYVPSTLGQAGGFKNGRIWLKFLHTCSSGEYLGMFFSFFENFDFWSLGTSFSAKTRLKLWGSLKASKKVGFD